MVDQASKAPPAGPGPIPGAGTGAASFVAPPYPYDRLAALGVLAGERGDAVVDLSIGTPCDPPPDAVVAALGSSGAERGYPASLGSVALRRAAVGWMRRRFGVDIDVSATAVCVGTKELVATVPWLLKLRRPHRRTVLYPEVSYPTYAMGAQLAGCHAVGVPSGADGQMDLDQVALDAVDDALLLWSNSPANPTGALDDLARVAAWGRARRIPVFSDECYSEFTWDGPPTSVLQHGSDQVVAVHSLSKRSNMAGMRAGFYAGDPDLVHELSELRRHIGMMVPGPVQAAATVAWDDDDHVEQQRRRYRRRLQRLVDALGSAGIDVHLPGGGFYLWIPVPGHWSGTDGWGLAGALAAAAGVVTSPGDLYGEPVAAHVRVAVVAPDDQIDLVARRIETAGARLHEIAAEQTERLARPGGGDPAAGVRAPGPDRAGGDAGGR